MRIDVLTLFPAMFVGPLDESIIKRARAAGLLDLRIHNLRDYAHDRHKTVDDRPFGGGPGMLLKPEPIFEAVEALAREQTRVILLSPAGRPFQPGDCAGTGRDGRPAAGHRATTKGLTSGFGRNWRTTNCPSATMF